MSNKKKGRIRRFVGGKRERVNEVERRPTSGGRGRLHWKQFGLACKERRAKMFARRRRESVKQT